MNVKCKHCGAELSVPDAADGNIVRCSHCNKLFVAKSPAAPSTPPPEAEEPPNPSPSSVCQTADDPDKPATTTRKQKMNFCPSCGQPVEAGDRFCSSCGTRLSDRKRDQPAEGKSPASRVPEEELPRPVKTKCSHCGAEMVVPQDRLMKMKRCPKCRSLFLAVSAEPDADKASPMSVSGVRMGTMIKEGKMSALMKMRDEADALKPVAMATVRCSHCKTPMSIPVTDFGKARKCPVCKSVFLPRAPGTSASSRRDNSAEESALIAQLEEMGTVGCVAMALIFLIEGPMGCFVVKWMIWNHVCRYITRARMRIQKGEPTSSIWSEVRVCQKSMGGAWAIALLVGAISGGLTDACILLLIYRLM